ncbi:MAG: ATP-binding protein [Sphingomonadales bacterium]|nr:ATP-binding protein [Sphingomonadales bacterium]
MNRTRSRNRLAGLVDSGLTAGETRHLRRACATLLRTMTDKQLELRAEQLLEYVRSRQVLFGLPDEALADITPAIAPLRRLAGWLGNCRPAVTSLDRRLSWLAATIGLDRSAKAILAVMARRILFASWSELFELLPIRCQNPNVAVLATMTGLSLAEVDRCLTPGAPLLGSHMLNDDRDGEFGTSALFKRIVRSHARTAGDMMAWLAPPAPASALGWDDFAHLGELRDLACRLLATGAPVSILLHGEPGTGKTEFAMVLAERLGRRVTFAGGADEFGNEPDRADRLGHLGLLRALCARSSDRLLVMDEADDVLALARHRNASKLWVNRAVESPGVATVWILNQVGLLDPAVLRRMTLAIAFDRPPHAVRERIARSAARARGLVLAEGDIRELAGLPASPALLANGLKAAAVISGGLAEAKQAIGSVLQAMGQGPAANAPAPDVYDAALSCAQLDLADLADRLGAAPERGWSLLLTGPSGTGKSAYARHLARRLGIEIEVRRGSDLLGKYVGDTEASIAAAFRQAETRGAMLLIDEADSFLFRRESGQRSWETSLVNEMLRQMENRSMPFVATTNFAELLDPAVQRRFTLRIAFTAMTPEQARTLFLVRFGGDWPSDHAAPAELTPGDFAVVARRARLLGEQRAGQIATWLHEEAQARTGLRVPIGFHRQA